MHGQRKQANLAPNLPHQELQKALQWQEAIIEGSRDAIFISNAKSEFVRVNTAACKLTGYSRTELLSMKIPDLHDELDLNAYRQYHSRILQGEEIVSEAKILKKDGSKVDVEFNNRRIVVAGETYIHTVARDVSERQRSAEALRASEERFRRIFEEGPLGMALVDSNFRLVRVNKKLCDLLGYAAEELLGKTFPEITAKEDVDASGHNVRRLWRGQPTLYRAEKRYLRKDGGTLWACTTVSAIRDKAGKPQRMLVMFEDISERKRAEEALRASEQRYRELLHRIPDGIYQTTPDGRILMANQALVRMLGYDSFEELRDVDVSQDLFFTPEEREQALKKQRERSDGTTMVRLRKKDGSELWVEDHGHIEYDSSGNPAYYQGVIRDITQRLQTEGMLRESERRYRALVECMAEGLLQVDNADTIVFVNRRFCEIMGYAPEELLGKHAATLFLDDKEQKVMQVNIQERLQGKSARYEIPMRTKSGDWIWVSINAVPIFDETGRVVGSIGMHTDITERKRTEEALHEKELRYRALFDRNNDAVFLFALDGRFLAANQRAAEMLGYDLEELTHKSVKDIVARFEQKDVDHKLEVLLAGGSLPLYERILRRKDGTEFPVEVNVALVRDPDGRPLHIQNIVRDISERKAAEKALRESEEQHRMVVENASEVILVAQDGRFKFFNRRLSEVTGYSREELTRLPFIELVHPDDRRMLADRHERRLRGEEVPREYDFRIVDRRGTVKWVRINSVLIDWEGRPATLNFLQDITERKQIREIQKAREKRFRKLQRALVKLAIRKGLHTRSLEHALKTIAEEAAKTLEVERVGIWLYNEDHSCINCLEQFELSRTRHSQGGQIEASDFPRYFKALQSERCIDAGDAVTDPRTREFADNYVKRYGIGAMLDAPIRLEGKVVGVVCHEHVGPPRRWHTEEKNFASSIADMVSLVLEQWERKQVKEALRESEQRFRELFDQAPDIYLLLDPHGKIQDINQLGLKTLAYTADEIVGRNLLDFVHEQDMGLAAHALEQIRKHGQLPRNLELRLLRKDGATIWVSKEFSLSRSKRGKLQVIRVVCRDITEHRQLEEELARSQRLETAGRVAGQIAHDFNNLLTPLTAYPLLVRDELPDDHPAVELLDEMQNAAQRIAEINQQLLALGRRGHYVMEPVDLNELVTKTLSTLSFPPQVIVELDLEEELFCIKGGSAQLTRALANLFLNAKEAMQGVGRLSLKTKNVYLDQPLHGYQTVARGEYVKLTVADTGTGIAPEILDRIFEPFFSTKKMDRTRGSGLGLSVVHGIMEDHNGYITVETKPGQGATFSLYFPVARDVALETKSTSMDLTGNGQKILFVDDDEVQRRVVEQLLKRLGYKVRTLPSGEEALRYLKKHPQDLLILDMVMDGMDGAETLRRVLDLNPKQRAILLSGYAVSDRVQEALKMGAGCYLPKPIILPQLARAVRQELDRNGQS